MNTSVEHEDLMPFDEWYTLIKGNEQAARVVHSVVQVIEAELLPLFFSAVNKLPDCQEKTDLKIILSRIPTNHE